jgi:hypothetical protein
MFVRNAPLVTMLLVPTLLITSGAIGANGQGASTPTDLRSLLRDRRASRSRGTPPKGIPSSV